MKLPVSWLREYVDVPEEPARIGEDLTMVGFELGGIEGKGKDAVLDLDVTTNRVDAMNVYGLAREVAVIYSRPLRPLELSFEEKGDPATSMTINATASTLLALYIAVGKRQGLEPGQLNGTIQNDILREYIARGTYIYPPKPSMRLVTDTFRYCSESVPRWNSISVSGYHIREAGATAVQELAFTFADAIAYVQAALDAGLNVDSFAGRLSFFFVAQNSLFEEVAKFRAARRMWARIMRERFGAENPRSWMMRFHTQTAPPRVKSPGETTSGSPPRNRLN